MTSPIARYGAFLEGLTVDNLDRLADQVTPDVRFADPFNDVTGIDPMRRIFAEMFDQVGPVRFTVLDARGDAVGGVLVWRFEAHLRGAPWSFEGTSVVRFVPDGRVVEHIDHWDAARHFYERLPIIGWLLGALRRKLATH